MPRQTCVETVAWSIHVDVKLQIDTCRIKRNTRSRWAAFHSLANATGLVCTDAFDLSISATLDTLDTADWVCWKTTGKTMENPTHPLVDHQ